MTSGISQFAQASPYLITLLGFVMTILTQNKWVFYFFVWMVACSMLNTLLKFTLLHCVGEHPLFVRPVKKSGDVCEPIKTSFAYGMPSGHAQFLTFVLVFGGLYIWKLSGLGWVTCSVLTLAMLAFTVYVGYSRVEMSCHTTLQVIVGMIVGAIIGFVAFSIGEKHLQ